MRTIRGLQITSFVVMSPVLLIMISLISILVVAIFSHVNSWLFQTTASAAVLQQQLITIRNVSSDISIPYQRNLNTNKQIKRIRLFSRLRQSPVTWSILSIIYAAYIIFKRKRTIKQKETLNSNNSQAIEPAKQLKKKSSKRRKPKKITAAINEPRHRPRSIQIASPPSTPPAPIVNNLKKENEPQPQQDNEIGNWVSVSGTKKNQQRKKELDVNIDPATTVTHFFPSPTFSCTSSINDHVEAEQPLNLYSFEPTPVHSEDDADDDEEKDHFIVKKTNKNWYSPFSTGLDLDIIPKQNQTDPLCLYKVDFNYNTNIPNNHPFRSTISNFGHPLSSIELLENHPFIPSANTKNHRSAFGPIGHKSSP
ncbi:hypothetical protein BD408DRAFT_413016 [Parasitella parasitica]|nr:hypothetical protein BD408DRAFT_413016 [Parasitella parasitica]